MVYPDLLTPWSLLEWNLPFSWFQIPITCCRHIYVSSSAHSPVSLRFCYLLSFFPTRLGIPWRQGLCISHLCNGLAKKGLRLLSKNKRHFSFHQELYWTTYSPFCSTTFCHFSGNFIILSSQNFLSFWVKNCSRCLLQSSRELKFFPLREFCDDQNKWKSEGAMSGEYGRWIRTSQPNCNSFCLVIKETCGLALSWWKIMRCLLTNSRRFSSSAAFSWSNCEHYLLELIIWFSRRSS